MTLPLFHPVCAACGARGEALCAACEGVLGVRPLSPCPDDLDGAFVAADYRGPVGAAVARAKIRGDREPLSSLGHALGHLAHDLLAGDFFQAVVPAPSPWTRRLRRGFAPAHVLAAQVASVTRLPLATPLAVSPGRRQSTLAARERRRNLEARLRSAPVRGRVLLIDDVVTTGATASSCARALREAGAEGVWLLALCAVQTAWRIP